MIRISIATSDLPSMLYKYIVKHYSVPLLKAHPDSLFDSVLNHQLLLDLFCDIITFQDLCSFSSEHLKISSYLLNHIAYRVFFMLENIIENLLILILCITILTNSEFAFAAILHVFDFLKLNFWT